MNAKILIAEIQDFINRNIDEDPSLIMLKGSPFPDVSAAELANQISAKKKSRLKHPGWNDHENVIYPGKISVEQSSSDQTALYKSKLISGKTILDMSGGMGIDSYFFSYSFDEVHYCEIDQGIYETAKHNFKTLKRENIKPINEDSVSVLKNHQNTFDWIYIDPARRDRENNRKFLLAETTPNVIELRDLLKKKSGAVMIKTSPLLDLKQGIRELKDVSQIHILALKNEVKEILWILKKGESGSSITCADIYPDHATEFSFSLEEEKNTESNFGAISDYIYEPNSAIMKAGAFKLIGKNFGLDKLNKNTHLYTLDKLVEFPGRIFRVIEIINYNKKVLRKRFGKTRMLIMKRNYPESVANIRKKTGILDGGNQYLIFTTDYLDSRVVLLCETIK